MRRLFPILMLLLLLYICNSKSPAAVSAASPEELDEGIWPETALTENIPQPEEGRVGQVLAMPDGQTLLITVEDLEYGALTAWLDRLTLSSFATAAFTQEGQTTCGLLTDSSTALSFSHLGNADTLTLSLSPDNP